MNIPITRLEENNTITLLTLETRGQAILRLMVRKQDFLVDGTKLINVTGDWWEFNGCQEDSVI